MDTAEYNRRPTTEILDALKGQVSAVTCSGQPAFQQVQVFDVNNLMQAIEDLLATEERLCFIVAETEQFSRKDTGGRTLLIARSLPVGLLISDRVIGDRQAAVRGSDTNPGAYALAEATLAHVTGQLLPNPAGVVCQPTSGGILFLEDANKRLPGRATYELDLLCTGGTLAARLALGPSI